MVGEIRMSQLMTTSAPRTDKAQIDRLCTAIRGKLQFMDYLVRAAVADTERLESESDTGTRIFLRQLIEMHTASLAAEGAGMSHVGDLCAAIDALLRSDPAPAPEVHRNGDAA
jgi:hypothetical protein